MVTLVASRGLPPDVVDSMRRCRSTPAPVARPSARAGSSCRTTTPTTRSPFRRSWTAASPRRWLRPCVRTADRRQPGGRPHRREPLLRRPRPGDPRASSATPAWRSRSRARGSTALNDAMHQALHDPLTGLPNRSLFVDRLAQSLGRTGRQGKRSRCSSSTSTTSRSSTTAPGMPPVTSCSRGGRPDLGACFRSIDTVARFGGDEFAVVVEDVADGVQADAWAARLLEPCRRR